LEDSTVSNNNATKGGGMKASYSQVELKRSKILLNSADIGGGISLVPSSLVASDCSIGPGNIAQVGGGVYTGNGMNLAFSLELRDGTYVRGNSATDTGGGVYLTRGYVLTVRKSSFQDNSAADKGGGVYCLDASIVVLLDGTEFLRNSARFGGAALLQLATFTASQGAILAYNSANSSGGRLFPCLSVCVSYGHH